MLWFDLISKNSWDWPVTVVQLENLQQAPQESIEISLWATNGCVFHTVFLGTSSHATQISEFDGIYLSLTMSLWGPVMT